MGLGLVFQQVLLELESAKIAEWSADVAKNLAYVGIPRAREQLGFSWARMTELIRQTKGAL